jgi:two-component system OmpR family sensor kinase
LERQVDIFDSLGRRRSRRPGPSTGKLPLSKNALRNATQGKPTFETIESSGSYPIRLLTVPVIKAGQVTDLVRVGMSLKNMHQTLNRFLLIMTAVLPLALLAGQRRGMASGQAGLETGRSYDPHRPPHQRRIPGSAPGAQSDSGDEMDRLARTINDMLDRLDISIKQMRQFSADASHELQTPLTILKGEMEVALRTPRSPEEYPACDA